MENQVKRRSTIDFYADNRLMLTANALSDTVRILNNIQKGGIAANSELIKNVQGSIKELCKLLLSYAEN